MLFFAPFYLEAQAFRALYEHCESAHLLKQKLLSSDIMKSSELVRLFSYSHRTLHSTVLHACSIGQLP